MLNDFALCLSIPNQVRLLQVLVKDQTLKPHLVFVSTISALTQAFVSSYKIEEDNTKIIPKFMILVPNDLMNAWELYFFLLNKLSNVSHHLLYLSLLS